VRRLLRHRDGRIYLTAQGLSLAGDNALWLAMGIYVKMLTGSNSAAGLTFFAFICGSLLAPVSGMVADRCRRRPLLIWANFTAAAGVCALLAAGPHRVWLIYVVMFCYGAIGSLILSAQTALLTVMFPGDLLGEANTVLQVAEQGLRVFTPLAGAGLLAWVGPEPVILLDAATFAAAGLAMLVIRLREAPPAASQVRWQEEFLAGIRYIGRTPALRRLLTAGVVALLAFGFFQTVPFAIVGQGLHRAPAFLGVLEATMGAGALLGAAVATAIMRRTSERGLVAGGLVSLAAACLLLTARWLPAVLAGMALVGACLIWVNVGAYTLLQRRTPPELLGRVDAALNLAVLIPQGTAIALGAALIAVLDYRILLLAMTVLVLVSAGHLLGRGEVPADVAADLAADARR
jgi:Na+/melibiose symporter-like transporter